MKSRVSKAWNSTPCLVLRSLSNGLMEFGGAYAVVEGLYKLINDESFEDIVAEHRALFSTVLVISVAGLSAYSYSHPKVIVDETMKNSTFDARNTEEGHELQIITEKSNEVSDSCDFRLSIK